MNKKNEKTNAVNEALKLPLGDVFEQELQALLQDGEQTENVTIAVFDIDKFDLVNKRLGYAEGDKVLIETGSYFLRGLPEGAKFYRFAGDMFSVIFPEETEKEDAFLLMEQLRKGYMVETGDGQLQTVTIGIAAAPEDGTRPAELIRKAEGAMFRGKVKGRNRTCLAREEKMVTKTSHYTVDQLQRLTKLSKREGLGEAILLREALDMLLKKYDV